MRERRGMRDGERGEGMSPAAAALVIGGVAAGAGLALRAAVRRGRRMAMAGRVALVTGGSRGLGLILARELARRGARVVIGARDGEELERARHDLRSRGADALAVPCDVGERVGVDAMIARVERELGPVEVLVNNAGLIGVGPAGTQTEEDYERMMRVHFWGALNAINAVLPGMLARGEGRIVNVSSFGGRVSVPHLLPYCASKFALTGLSEGLRAELAGRGVYVTTVTPGPMRTGSQYRAEFKGRHRAEFALFMAASAVPGLSISADEAGRRIVDAAEHGDAALTPGLAAKVASVLHGVAPGLVADALALVNAALPGAGGIGSAAATGEQSRSALSESPVTASIRRAAVRNNEVR